MTQGPGRPDGFSNERTRLSWQRTALALLAGAALLARLTFEELGAASLLVLVVAVPLTVWVMVEARVRYGRGAAPAAAGERGGRAALALTVVVVALALTELASLATRW